ncbi:hypothetical protein BDZ85DRAFT_263464 [Elsinoe ampelina]|uniref:Arf-GAP domain-containing protein n=1 Tax=Elsinoe ampelina TaxID=302913 RepID=A0A6A6G9G6_9PEZI|nr:hypothetical protein BDZ85DRAFT_263464 [Elsinoe ampelina]
MAALVSKRAQARNEKALQELISSVPGNGQCADCGAKNPGWASWSLGIFLCVRCASLHRKLGTHISKVKSLSMDSWNAEQVDTMKRVGNTTSNRTFNPKNVKPSIPVDVDEADGVMERFIRQKYEHRAFISGAQPARQRAGSHSSDDGHRPPLPPKPGKKFGFGLRSTSSVIPRRDNEKFTPPLSPSYTGSNGSASPAKANKQSRVLGSTVGNQDDDFDAKLATLRDMGFKDTRRNSTILKSLGGNVDRTVEALVRIGETSKPPSGTITPVSAGSAANGLTVEKRRTNEGSMGNPFDALDNQPQQTQQRSVTMPVQQAAGAQQFMPQQAYNPYQQPQAYPSQQDQLSLHTGFQNLQVSQPSQYTASPATNYASNPFLPQPQQSQQPQAVMSPSFQAPQYDQSQQPEPSNPFLRRVQSQTFQPNPWGQQMAPQRTQSPAANPWMPQQQQQFVQTPQAQSPMGYSQAQDGFSAPAQQPQAQQSPMYSGNNPFNSQPGLPQSTTPSNTQQQPFESPAAFAPQSPFGFAPQQPQQPQQPYFQQPQAQQYFPQQQNTYPPASQSPAPAPYRHDKSSILALYSQPHLAPSRPLGSLPEDTSQQPAPQRSVTMPHGMSLAGGNMNPFAANGGQQGYAMNGQQQPQALAGAGQPDAFGWLNQG